MGLKKMRPDPKLFKEIEEMLEGLTVEDLRDMAKICEKKAKILEKWGSRVDEILSNAEHIGGEKCPDCGADAVHDEDNNFWYCYDKCGWNKKGGVI